MAVNKNQRKGKWMKKIISACVAFILAFFVVNGIMFAYERPVAWIDTPNGASRAVRNPNAMLIHGTEGYSISKIDSYGFTNQNYALADEYILMMGASHSQGKEITISNRYSTIVNNMLVDDKEELRAFNIACDGHFLPSIINHFQSAIENYPKANCVTIEIMSTDYSIDDLRNSLILADEIDTKTAIELFASQSSVKKAKNMLKEYLPLIAMIKNHIETSQKLNSSGGEKNNSINEEEYRTVITDGLSLMRSCFDGPIVFIYHPTTKIQTDGTLKLIRSQTLEIFKEECEHVGIDFIDTGDAFLEHYNKYHELPYGFANTTPGNGHLNEVGHKIMADVIMDYLEEVDCK